MDEMFLFSERVSADVCLLAHATLLTVSRPGTLCFWTKRAVEGQELVTPSVSQQKKEKRKKAEDVLVGEFNKEVIFKGMGRV